MSTKQARADAKLVGTKAPDAQLRDSRGGTVALSSCWKARPLVLLLLEDLTSESTADQLTAVRDAHGHFDEAGAAVTIVVLNRGDEIEAFKSDYNFKHVILSDRAGDAHRAFGSSAVGSFVIDTEGVVRYAHQAGSGYDTPPLFDLIDAVSALTGSIVERPQAPDSVIAFPSLRAESSALRSARGHGIGFTCAKCGSGDYETIKIATSGGWLSRIFNFQYRRFIAIVCSDCGYAELYRTNGNTVSNIADLLIGS